MAVQIVIDARNRVFPHNPSSPAVAFAQIAVIRVIDVREARACGGADQRHDHYPL
jgi:hypothetical protein